MQTAAVDEKVKQFFQAYPARSYSSGETLIFADEDINHIFYLTEGNVRQYDISYRGDEIVLNVFKPGTFFPMSNAFNKTKNPYFFRAETNVQVHVAPVDEVLKFVGSDPEVLTDLLTRLYRGLDGLLGRVVQLMSGSAKERLLYELVIECRRFGKKNKSGEYLLKVNESDLAARSGLSRETVSREMHKIKADGLAKVDSNGIIVRDLIKLEEKINL